MSITVTSPWHLNLLYDRSDLKPDEDAAWTLNSILLSPFLLICRLRSIPTTVDVERIDVPQSQRLHQIYQRLLGHDRFDRIWHKSMNNNERPQQNIEIHHASSTVDSSQKRIHRNGCLEIHSVTCLKWVISMELAIRSILLRSVFAVLFSSSGWSFVEKYTNYLLSSAKS